MLLSNLLALITFVQFIQTLSIKCFVSNAVFSFIVESTVKFIFGFSFEKNIK